MKVCTKCKVEQDESLFSKNRGKKDGLSSCCKKCDNERKANNKDKIKETRAKYKESNKDKIKESSAKYRENNKEKIKECQAKYRAKHQERIMEYRKKYHLINKDKSNGHRKEQARNLADSYVMDLIRSGTSLKYKDIPSILIEAKRIQMLIKRTIKEMTK